MQRKDFFKWKQCQYLAIIKVQNVMHRFPQIYINYRNFDDI